MRFGGTCAVLLVPPGKQRDQSMKIGLFWAFRFILDDQFARTTDARIILRNSRIRHDKFYQNEKLPRIAWAMALSSELRNADLIRQKSGGQENIFPSSFGTWSPLLFSNEEFSRRIYPIDCQQVNESRKNRGINEDPKKNRIFVSCNFRADSLSHYFMRRLYTRGQLYRRKSSQFPCTVY